jgi:hypothetical protein
MNQREAKRDACKVVALLIDGYFAVGQPQTECAEHNPKHPKEADECPDCHRQYEALKAIMEELERRADRWVPVSWQRHTRGRL